MEKNINQMIEDIYNREKQAEQQNAQLNKARTNIHQCQESIRKTKLQKQDIQGKLNEQGKRLQQDKAKLKTMTARQSVLEAAKYSINTQIRNLISEQETLKKTMVNEDEQLNTDIEEFLEYYDLTSDGGAKREKDVKRKIEEVETEKEIVEKEMVKIRCHKASIKDLEWTRDTTKRLINELERRRLDLFEQKEKCEGRVDVLLEEKKTLSAIPQTSSEYIQLQDELKSSNVNEKRDEYIQLQKTLAGLRRQQDTVYSDTKW